MIEQSQPVCRLYFITGFTGRKTYVPPLFWYMYTIFSPCLVDQEWPQLQEVARQSSGGHWSWLFLGMSSYPVWYIEYKNSKMILSRYMTSNTVSNGPVQSVLVAPNRWKFQVNLQQYYRVFSWGRDLSPLHEKRNSPCPPHSLHCFLWCTHI